MGKNEDPTLSMNLKKVDKWYTKLEYVDRHSGEILKRHEVIENYCIKNKIKSYEFKESINRGRHEIVGTRVIRNECERRNKQGKLFDY